VVIDPEASWTLTRETLAGRSWNTPFLGRKLKGKARNVIAGGVARV
jgi:dihydroorotase